MSNAENPRAMNDFCAALIETNGNMAKAARQAGISRSTAYKYKKSDEFAEIYDYLMGFAAKVNLDVPDSLKGQMFSYTQADITDYFDSKGRFLGFENLTKEQRMRIKKFSRQETKHGTNYTIELHDAKNANENLSRPHGLYDKVNYDLSIFDGLSDEKIRAIGDILGWSDSQLEEEIERQVVRRMEQLGRM